MDGFTIGAVAFLTEQSTSRIRHWAKRGVVVPSVTPPAGTGSQALYGLADVYALRVAARLTKFGIGLDDIRQVIKHVAPQLEDPSLAAPAGQVMLLTTRRAALLFADEQVVGKMRDLQRPVARVVDLGALLEDEIVSFMERRLLGLPKKGPRPRGRPARTARPAPRDTTPRRRTRS